MAEATAGRDLVELRGRHLRLWRGAVLAVVTVPFLGLVVAGVWWHERGLDAVQHLLFLGTYLLSGFGITLGYHRLFTHRSFRPRRWIEVSLAILGSMAVQGPLIRWVAEHRRHHQHSDRDGDPHSPHALGYGLRGLARGFLHAHLGWFFDAKRTSARRYAGDLFSDPLLRWIDSLYPAWVLASAFIPSACAYLLQGTASSALAGLLWPGLARIFFVQHVTWSVNSVCHLFGTRDFASHDEGRNNWAFGLLALGEGWHNGHHAFPNSARHGLLWYQLDLSYLVIRLLELVRLASAVRRPEANKLLEKRIAMPLVSS